MITYNINLCIGRDDPDKRLTIKCHDTGAKFRVHLFERKVGEWSETHIPYTIPKGSTAILKIAKADNTYCVSDGEIEGAGSVLFAPKPQAFTAQGIAKTEVSLFDAEGKRITSATFYIDVAPEALCDCESESESYVDVFAEQIKKAEAAAGRAENAASHQPIIGTNMNWFVWDAEKQEYIDSGWRGVGENGSDGLNGKDGINGKDGKDGADGYTPVKGKDYYTLTEKEALVEEISTTVTGDIDTAIDAILTLQEAYIGGDAE